ncbi:MAG: PRC-barrel domain-containing protein [Stellaceae bacterium]
MFRVRQAWAPVVVAMVTLTTWSATWGADRDEGSMHGVVNTAPLEHLSPDHVFRLLGRDVLSATGEKMGRIVDLLFERSGKPCAAIVDFGGFLGVGSWKIAVDWKALRFDMGEKKDAIIVDLGREQLQSAPEYKGADDRTIPVVTPSQFGPSGASIEHR